MRIRYLAVIALAALAVPARAEINVADAVEWQTADADVVVRGFVTAATRQKLGNAFWWELTVQIGESIKGGVKQSLRFGMRATSGDRPLEWRAKKTDLVLFLVDGKDRAADDPSFARFTYVLRDATGGDHASAFELGANTVFTASYDALTKPTGVLAAIRGAAQTGATRSFRVDVPWDTAAMKALYAGSAVWMMVPVDAALEKQALQWIAGADVGTREQGVRALGHFKSDANIAGSGRCSPTRASTRSRAPTSSRTATSRCAAPHTRC